MARVSVIIPALDEERMISETVRSASGQSPFEVIVVDGGSDDDTREAARRAGACVVDADRGRAAQLNEGVRHARGDVFLFLHADTILRAGALDDIAAALSDERVVGGGFRVRLAGRHPLLPLVAGGINLRTRLFRSFTGDQAIFVRRDAFERMGGFPDWPLFEDVHASDAMRRLGRVRVLPARVVTSGRRWEARGVVRTVLTMWRMRLLYRLGRRPEVLARGFGGVR